MNIKEFEELLLSANEETKDKIFEEILNLFDLQYTYEEAQ